MKRMVKRVASVSLAAAVAACLDRFHVDHCLESFDPRPLLWLRRHRPDILRGQLAKDFRRDPGDQNAWNRLAVRLCRRFGVRTAYWTLKSPAQVARAEREGALPIFEETEKEDIVEQDAT